MKKVSFIIGGIILATLTVTNVNLGRNNTLFMKSIISNVEAYASGSEGGSEGHRCGRAAYDWDPASKEHNFVQCVRKCPDKQGNNPLYQDC